MISSKIYPKMGLHTVLACHISIFFANITPTIIIKLEPFYSRIFISLWMHILTAYNFIVESG